VAIVGGCCTADCPVCGARCRAHAKTADWTVYGTGEATRLIVGIEGSGKEYGANVETRNCDDSCITLIRSHRTYALVNSQIRKVRGRTPTRGLAPFLNDPISFEELFPQLERRRASR